jgi:hypothetical protein
MKQVKVITKAVETSAQSTTLRCKVHTEAKPVLHINEPGAHHYGKWVCIECGKYIAHARRPATTEALQVRQKAIVGALATRSYTPEQIAELCELYSVPHLNLVQQRRYDSLKLDSVSL